jgi:hypothetical protein
METREAEAAIGPDLTGLLRRPAALLIGVAVLLVAVQLAVVVRYGGLGFGLHPTLVPAVMRPLVILAKERSGG